MDVSFLGQPFAEEPTLGDLLSEHLEDAESFLACVAWVQRSGLDHLRDSIQAVAGRGGDTEAIIGIDGGIATAEGLQDALETFAVVRLFHHAGFRTFHPKLYVVDSNDERLVVVGSSNLTEGGLYTNYEATLALRLRNGLGPDDAVFAQVCQYVDALRALDMPSLTLDGSVLQELRSRPGVLSSEVERRKRLGVQRARLQRALRDLFGETPASLRRAPRVRRRRSKDSPGTTGRRRKKAEVQASWSKTLTISDAMRKTVGNQRAYVILNKAGHDIDQKTYFRHEFFDGVAWRRHVMHTGNLKEIADVAFEVSFEEQDLGSYAVRVDHAENRIARQNNAPTWMHWSTLIDLVRETDLTNYTLTLERLAGESFRLRLRS